MGLPRWHSDKESTCKCRRHRRHRFVCFPGLGKFPGVGNGNPHSILLGKSHGQRSPVGSSPLGHKELDTTERLTLSFFTFPIPYASHFRSFLFTPSPYPATTLVVPVNLLCLHRSDFLNFSAPTNHPGPLGGSDFIRGGGVEICYFYKQPQGILIRRLPSPLFMEGCPKPQAP